MEKVISFLKKHLPEEILNTLQKKEFSQGEYIYTKDNTNIYLLLEGRAIPIRYEDSKEIFFPFKFHKGSFMGINKLFINEGFDWDIKITSKSAKLLVLPHEIIDKHIFSNPILLKYFAEKGMEIVNRGRISYYIKAQGGASAFLAHIIVTNSNEGKLPFNSNSNIAKSLGVSRKTFYETIKNLEENKLIIKNKKEIIILNEEGLKKLYSIYMYD